MTTIKLTVNGASATATLDGILTSGMVGVGVKITYDDIWNGLSKTACFRVGNMTRKRDNVGTFTTVPWEVMRNSGKPLEIGIEGKNEDGSIVIPTVWATVSTVLPGANAAIPAAPNPYGEGIPTGGAVIDDSVVDLGKTWSSKKVSEEIEKHSMTLDASLSVSGAAADSKTVGNRFALIGQYSPEEVAAVSKNLYNEDASIVGYYVDYTASGGGQLAAGSSYKASDWIPVEAGKTYVLSYRGAIAMSYRWCVYDSENVRISGAKDSGNPFTIPEGGAFIRFSVAKTVENVQFEEGTEPTEYEPYGESGTTKDPAFYLNRDPIGFFRVNGDLADGEELILPFNNAKNKTVTVFSCIVSTMGKVFVGKKTDANEAPYVVIDNTNVEVHGYSDKVTTKAHGLTIGSNLLVRIETGETMYVERITVSSGASSFEVTDESNTIRWTCDKGGPFVRSDGSVLTGCVLSWTCRNISAPVWVFGDSYVSHEYSNRWTYHLFEDGYGDSLMLNGYAGAKSEAVLLGLKNLLGIARPQYIVWALGMNDEDTDTEANSAWLDCFYEVADICNRMNIAFVAATIPQTPSMNNSFKNAIIRDGDWRYVDFEAAVVADASTGTWYDGMLALPDDDVHPTVAGAKALYYRFLCDFPEVMTL